MAIQKIGILTSGGDCGGLNGVIIGAARLALSRGIKAYLIPNGYAGLYNLVDFPGLVELTESRIEDIHVYLAGSEAGNSRVKISKIKDEKKYDRIREGLKKFGIDALVISGGDDSGSVVVDLASQGIPCVHAPKTMDLDLMPYSVGGDSTVARIAEFTRDLYTTGRTHNRIVVMEVFGRYAGHTAFRGGIAAGADAILIPEVPVDFDLLYKHVMGNFIRRVESSDARKGTAAVIVAEGLKDSSGKELVDESSTADAFGHKKLMGAGKYVVKQLEDRVKKDPAVKEFMKRTGQFVEGVYEIPEIREVRPGHLVRCGFTSPVDANFGLEVGAAAVELHLKGINGVTVISYQDGKIRYMPVAEAIVQRHVDIESIALYERMGICFGRAPANVEPKFEKFSGRPERVY
ncbi:MAG TPA: 6-phosphofructokinase [Leptospiraceae bacterium]|nr:6-phosphofructokinase [Leptospirales bacterium]HMU84560.1 6-phosphofructokinase [Leptospiraceae bacterium]HMX55063.1 6-phosphofructokinase [Leptospiraceae bacterium]HNE23848.1 6-phosphofructokinase [Leptospiraceae bacterium]HNL02304.1 6-phosphofructokinase [Leptospiraceae bacterium]